MLMVEAPADNDPMAPDMDEWLAATVDDAGPVAPPPEPEPPVFRMMQQLRRELQVLHDALLQRDSDNLGESVLELADRLRALVARDADAALAAMQLDVGED